MRFLRDFQHCLFYYLLTRTNNRLVTLGSGNSWTIHPDAFSGNSQVLCAGAGSDISFEIQLGRKLGHAVLLLYPSPTGLKTWQSVGASCDFISFLPVALAGEDGSLILSEPLDDDEGSFRSLGDTSESCITVPCRSVQSLMKERGWNSLDLLKMDIEGAEYAVIDSILRSNIVIRQICVEFHHGKGFTSTRRETISAILRLRKAGFRPAHRIYNDHTFVHKSVL